MYPADWARQRLLASKMLDRLSTRIPGFKRHEPEGRMLLNVAMNDFRNYVRSRPPSSDVSHDEYADFWAERWLDKWRERVKLVFGQQDAHVFAKHERMIKETTPLWRSFPHLSDALELIIDALIDVGELCFTNLLAETTLRGELARVRQSSKSLEEAARRVREGALSLVKSAVFRARSYKHVRGYLVWLRVDEHIWRTSKGKIVETPTGEGEELYEAVDL